MRGFITDEATLIARRPEGWRPGQDAAGAVIRAAADGSGPAEDARVACYLEQEGWAEQVPVPTHCIAELDDAVSFEQAAALPIAGLTALRALRVGGAVLGRQVLVSGPERIGDAQALGAHRVVTSLDDATLGPFHLVLEGVGGDVLAILARLVADGRLTPRIGLVLDWERTPEVFEQLAARAFRGKAVLTLSE